MRDVVVVSPMTKVFVVLLWPILFTLMPCFHCQPNDTSPIRSRDCPYKGLLVLRPLDPVFQAGVPSRICCQAINPTTGKPLPNPIPTNLKISCKGRSRQTSIIPLAFPKKPMALDLTCANVTFNVPTVGPAGYCVCEVPGKPQCRGSQFVSVDAALPGSLEVKCVTHDTDNVTCTTLNMPTLLHEDKAVTIITWTQIGPHGNVLGPKKSRVCTQSTSCTLSPCDGIYTVLPVTLNISVQVQYEYYGTWVGQRQTKTPVVAADKAALATATSQWMTLHIQGQVKLEPLRASITASNATTITVQWDRQRLTAIKDSVVIIHYHADQDGWTSFNRKEIREKMEFTWHPTRVVLRDLRPSTTYMMALRARTTDSDALSDPVYLTARTRSSAGG